MKGEIYKCETCNKWTENVHHDRWIELQSFNGNTTISKACMPVITLLKDEPKHFCSVRCFIEYIATSFNTIQNEIDISDKILELLETDDSIDIGNVKVTKLSEFKLGLNATIPSELWQDQVRELGLNPDDYLISNEDKGAIINIYKAHYELNL